MPLLLIFLLALVLLEATTFEGFLPYDSSTQFADEPSESFWIRVRSTSRYAWGIRVRFSTNAHRTAAFFRISIILALGNAYLISKVWKPVGRSGLS
jgi:hypothetical protein